MEQYYAWFLWMTRRIGYNFGALAHSLYTRNSLEPQDTEAWQYYYNLRLKQTSTKNSAQDQYWCKYFRKKCKGGNMKYHWVEWGSNPRRRQRHSGYVSWLWRVRRCRRSRRGFEPHSTQWHFIFSYSLLYTFFLSTCISIDPGRNSLLKFV